MRSVRETVKGHEAHLIITALIVLFVVVFFFDRIFVVIEPGHAGVIFRPLFGGTVIDRTYGEGLHAMFPWDRMYSYNMRVQETTRTLTALTSDNLSVTLELSIRYHPDASMVGLLHTSIGPNYVEAIVVPEVLGVVRNQVSQRTVDELVSGHETAPQEAATAATTVAAATTTATTAPPPAVPGTVAAAATASAPGTAASAPASASTVPLPPTKSSNVTLSDIVQSAGDNVSRKYVIVDGVVLVKATLPVSVQSAIEQKIAAKQQAFTQMYRLAAADAEAKTNVTLNSSLTPALLTWKGIETTKELAASPNSKIIFIGNSANALPVILGSEKTP